MFQTIFRLCLLQGSPADLRVNSSTVITLGTVLAVLAWMGGGGVANPDSATLSSEEFNALKRVTTILPLFQHAITGIMIFTVLSIRKLNGRFLQTLVAYLGVQIVFHLGVIVVNFIAPVFPAGLAIVFGAIQLGLLIWLLTVLGYTLRHAFAIKMWLGVLAAFVITLLSLFLAGIAMGLFFPNDMMVLVDGNLIDSPPSPTLQE